MAGGDLRSWELVVNGIPKPQPRDRTSAAKIDGRWMGRRHPDGSADQWKLYIHDVATAARPDSPIEGPVRVDVDLFFHRPQKWCRKMDERERPGPIVAPIGRRSDRDNLDKAVLDSLVQAGFLADDGVVVLGEIRKLYHAIGGRCGAVIRIRELDPGQSVTCPTVP